MDLPAWGSPAAQEHFREVAFHVSKCDKTPSIQISAHADLRESPPQPLPETQRKKE